MRRVLVIIPSSSIDELVTQGICLRGKSRGYYVYDGEEVNDNLIKDVKDVCNLNSGVLVELRISNINIDIDIRNIVAIYRVMDGGEITLLCNLKGESIFKEYLVHKIQQSESVL